MHLVFAGENMRADYLEPIPEIDLPQTLRGLPLISPTCLLRM
jgi:hypothetical protein